MSKIKSTIWPIEPHTEAKHAILRKYLDAWLPIISRWNGRVLYIDGFAGPGEYKDGEDGSPIIAIKAILEHRQNHQMSVEFNFLFIEDDNDRCEYLKSKLDALKLPTKIKYQCIRGRFDKVVEDVLKKLEEEKAILAPTFVFIDPFGYSGMPLSIIKEIMTNKKCEVLITFMYEEINRFLEVPNSETALDDTFGTTKWREVNKESDPNKRCYFLHDLYKEQLHNAADIEYVRSFKMKNSMNKTDYFLFFGTNDITGLKKMKEAMWRVDETGSFQFSDATYNPDQAFLFGMEPNYVELKNLIIKKFKGKPVSVKVLENFIVTETSFTQNHYKRKILGEMERAIPLEIRVQRKHGARRGTFLPETIVEFI